MTRSLPSEAPTVLLVDDDTALADSLALWLERRVHVRVAYSGREALQSFDEEVDLVFLDQNLPGLSGTSVLSELRRQSESVRVVMLTATHHEDLSGIPADEILTKPVDKDALFAAVSEYAAETSGLVLD
ncbi:response regulator transcription factor [Haloferax namakaokahaiae]|uniref:Response regulator transcription factor n=1 Tax=Haloferax namakaokahaiae TaxID=1748331 RepID=A0ABD5ZF06_9EURY